ncbi:MAG: hypothetical protein ISR90_04755 [Candidatus Marinimicrobia bacterium]|nr:hypothetical protein [Candidatus Neomarinimicrobiota bacterium]MBL7023348.1 hypothetical protein [Candidatus Neomarinimicrobiota bacterium]MBL7109307.1 hypothetical protein [Candidatus Neomarinimicrobiota bacterium]
MKKFMYVFVLLSFVFAQSFQFNSLYLTEEIRSSVKSLLNYEDIAVNIEDDQSRIEFYQAVSEVLHFEIIEFNSKSEEKYKNYQEIVTKYSNQLNIKQLDLHLIQTPDFKYEYKPIEINMKNVQKQLHKKQAKILRKQFLQLYKNYKSNKEIFVQRINELKEQIKEQEKIAKQQIDKKTEKAKEKQDKIVEVEIPKAKLSFGKLNTDTQTLEILYFSETNIHGFQFDYTGIKIKDCINEMFTNNLSSSKILGFSMSGGALPSGNGRLVEIHYETDKETNFCISNLKLAGSKGTEILAEYDGCIEIPGTLPVEALEQKTEITKEEIREPVVEETKPVLIEKVEIEEHQVIEESAKIEPVIEQIKEEVVQPYTGDKSALTKQSSEEFTKPVVVEKIKETVEKTPIVTKKEQAKSNDFSHIARFGSAFKMAKNEGFTKFKYKGRYYSTLTRTDFRRAFRRARGEGRKSFYFSGRRYSTKLAGESEKEWKEKLGF